MGLEKRLEARWVEVNQNQHPSSLRRALSARNERADVLASCRVRSATRLTEAVYIRLDLKGLL
jgi:hypothetical protein